MLILRLGGRSPRLRPGDRAGWGWAYGPRGMPLEFLSDAQVAEYGRFDGVPARADLERFFVLDDADKNLLGDRRGDHHRLGLMLQDIGLALAVACGGKILGAMLPARVLGCAGPKDSAREEHRNGKCR